MTRPKNTDQAPDNATPQEPGDLIWGIHPVLEMLEQSPRQVREITIQQPGSGRMLQKIIELARSSNVKVRFKPLIIIPGTGKVNHQGVTAKLSPVDTLSIEEVIAMAATVDQPLIIALDSIQDPHNLGAIIRSACGAGALAVVTTRDRSAPLGGTAAKVAAGAMALTDICLVTNLTQALQQLKDAGFWIYGADGTAEKSIYQTDFSGPVCLVIGGEDKGIRPLVRENCDFLTKIPIQASMESLNAAVAAGIIIFEIVRQKFFSKV